MLPNTRGCTSTPHACTPAARPHSVRTCVHACTRVRACTHMHASHAVRTNHAGVQSDGEQRDACTHTPHALRYTQVYKVTENNDMMAASQFETTARCMAINNDSIYRSAENKLEVVNMAGALGVRVWACVRVARGGGGGRGDGVGARRGRRLQLLAMWDLRGLAPCCQSPDRPALRPYRPRVRPLCLQVAVLPLQPMDVYGAAPQPYSPEMHSRLASFSILPFPLPSRLPCWRTAGWLHHWTAAAGTVKHALPAWLPC